MGSWPSPAPEAIWATVIVNVVIFIALSSPAVDRLTTHTVQAFFTR